MLEISLGIDIEPDCPPYLATQYRGVVDGLPRILDELGNAGVPTTCFCTGEVAERYPQRVTDLIQRGHELGCHGHTHRPFDTLSPSEARKEIAQSSQVLRSFGAPVTSFRAPNLRFPDGYLELLEERGFLVDSSQAKYKRAYYRSRVRTTLKRFPASTTSSVLRLPRWIRDPFLLSLASPVILFVHPWEFVDLTREKLRIDCRFRTGRPALRAVLEVVDMFKSRGVAFVRMDALSERVGDRVSSAA
jgi:peptidoglycan/xylan/chitin deacetylase (PgdA/CDA1 family)